MSREQDLAGIGMTSQRTRDRLIARLREEGITDERVLAVMRQTPRHLFVDEALAHRAYDDTALPIGHSQSISQPHVVAAMTSALLGAGSPSRVLEIGTGCGYQTAVLAGLCRRVFTIERVRPLSVRAQATLKRIGMTNVRFLVADGMQGWPAEGPFDAIIATAAPTVVPAALIEQLAVGGRLVIPVGTDGRQELQLIERTAAGMQSQVLKYVRFVPMIGGVVER